MSERDFISELSRLSNQKQQLEYQRDLAYTKMDNLYHTLNEQFEIFYPYFNEFGNFYYDITNVDFYFGEIACEYRGENYSLSNRLFELNEQLLDVDVFDLTLSQLVRLYNLLVMLYHDLGNHEFTAIQKGLHSKFTVNDIIEKIKNLTDCFIEKTENKQEGVSKELASAVYNLYILIDFALYEDEAHNDLRKLRNLYIEVENASYNEISECGESLGKIDEMLDDLRTKSEMSARVQEEKNKARKNAEIQAKREAIDRKSDKFSLVSAVIICILLSITVSIFVFQTVKKANEDFVSEHTFVVDTYVCYVTDTGSKYHAGYCQYLYNSSNKTTVYRAKNRGYTACSKCAPSVETQIEVFDSRGDTRPIEVEDAMSLTLTILVFAVPVGGWFLRKLLKKFYLLCCRM